METTQTQQTANKVKALNQVNKRLTEAKNDLQQRYNELRRIEDHVNNNALHNHYY
jgi:hypothetical protein